MSKDQNRRMSGRTALKLAAAAVVFGAGLLLGGALADGGKQQCGPSTAVESVR